MELGQYLKAQEKIAVAFSGGVDSAYLLYEAKKHCAATAAYYVKTPFQPEFELADAQKLCRELGVPLTVVEIHILNDREIAANPKNRCYFCKRKMLSALIDAAAKDGFSLVADGTNASDQEDGRPGMQALKELGVASPLRLCGLTKEEIRRRSREAGLFTHDKPAYACLATRVPAGEEITAEKLRCTAESEAYLRSLGLGDFRVRYRGGGALLQVSKADLPLAQAHWQEIEETLKKWYCSVVLDQELRNG